MSIIYKHSCSEVVSETNLIKEENHSNQKTNFWRMKKFFLVLWFTPVYLAARSSKVYVFNGANRDCSSLISKIYNFYCSVLFHPALSPGMYCELIYTYIDLFIHKYSFWASHVWFILRKKKKSFSISLLKVRGSYCHCYHNTFIVIYFSVAALHLFTSYYSTRTSNHCGSLVGKLDCMGLHERKRMCL